MGIESLKRWHWAIIGILIGLSLGYTRLRIGAATESGRPTFSLDKARFEAELVQAVDKNQPVLDHIVVYPMEGGLYRVTMRRWMPKMVAGKVQREPKDGWEFRPHDHAYTPLSEAPAKADPNYTVVSYLRDAAKKNPGVKFRYAWWADPKSMIGLYTLGGLVVVGGLWPTMVSFLVGAGYGRPAKDPEYDLDRFQSEPEAPKAAALAPDDARLAELEEELLKSLSADDAARLEEDLPKPQRPKGPVALDNTPLTQAPAQKSVEDCDFKGEFYPVARKPGQPAPAKDPTKAKPAPRRPS